MMGATSLASVIFGTAGALALGYRLSPNGPPVPSSSSSSSSGDGFSLAGGGGGGGGATAEWFASLPKLPGPTREAAIFHAFDSGFTRGITWVTVRSSATIAGAQRTLDVDVMDDSLAVGTDSDWIRVSMSARTQQAIADAWPAPGVYLCTSKVADLIAANAQVRIAPCVMSARPDIGTQHMSETWVMLEYNRAIEQLRAGRAGLLSDAGKYWIASARLGSPDNPAHVSGGGSQLASANYGFFVLDANGSYAAKQGSHVGTGGWSHGPGQWAVWQNVGLAHNLDHADYSQTCRLVGRRAVLDGQQDVDLQDIASDPQLCALVSDEGPVLLRVPAIPRGALLVA